MEPEFAGAYYNLGNLLNDLGISPRSPLKEAETCYRRAISITPDSFLAYNNLGNLLTTLGRLDEAKACYKKAIIISPDFAEAHNNLGNIMKNLSRLEESEVFYRKAISIKPDYFEAYSNLGSNLRSLGKFEEAESSCRKAITLNPYYAKGYSDLSIILYSMGNLNPALETIEKGYSLDPNSKTIKLLLAIIKFRVNHKSVMSRTDNINNIDFGIRLASNPLLLNRPIESELISTLYEIKSLELGSKIDPTYGNAKGSDYQLFENGNPIIKNMASDLVEMIKQAVNADIYIEDSFFTIYGSGGGGINRHNHTTNPLDTDASFNLASQKYSLVYYVSAGDQNCSEPGILKLYDPSEDILPTLGMITIFPADRYHSVVYNGKKDRVIIGVNFYCI